TDNSTDVIRVEYHVSGNGNLADLVGNR
ncbi:uncharacterized protein METZ01_LOCUS302340, partial [marine metagenome]